MNDLTIFITQNGTNEIYKSNDQIFKYINVDQNEITRELNLYFGEVSTIYWVYKNIKSDYYGFFQYRRYLSFAKHKNKYPQSEKKLTKDIFAKYNLNSKAISDIVNKYDIIVPYKKNFVISNGLFANVYRQYKYCYEHTIKDLDDALKILHDIHPEFDTYAKMGMKAKKAYCNNVFIMKKEYFDGYCDWLFPILLMLHENRDYTNSSTYNKRSIGFVAERLFNIYMLYLLDANKDIKIHETQLVVIGEDKPQNIDRLSNIKKIIPEHTKLGRILRCIYHTIKFR